MNRWGLAAGATLVGTIAWFVFVPSPGDCPNAGFNECGGFQVSPFFVGSVGLFLATFFGFLSVIRSSR